MRINTPCIGICSTVYGDEVCRGCKRRYREIIDWNKLEPDYQDQIWARLNSQAELVLNQKIKIINLDLFNAALSMHHVIKTPKHGTDFLILLLIKKLGLEIKNFKNPEDLKNLKALGLEASVNLNLDLESLDQDFYQLADGREQ